MRYARPSWALSLLAALCAVPCTHASAQVEPTDDEAQEAPTPSTAPRAPWSLSLAAGLGAGSRELDLPRDGVVYQVRSGLFPAVELGFELSHDLSQDFTLGLLARYQTSLGLALVEKLTDGSEHSRSTRSHHLELGLAPTLRLDAQGRWALAAAVGFHVSELDPEAHLITPSYFMSGPFLRVELQLPLASDRVRLRIGPEAQWIAQVGRELLDRGIRAGGLGAGGSATLELALARHWTVAASYRELRSWLDSSQASSFVDVSRFVTARLSGTL